MRKNLLKFGSNTITEQLFPPPSSLYGYMKVFSGLYFSAFFLRNPFLLALLSVVLSRLPWSDKVILRSVGRQVENGSILYILGSDSLTATAALHFPPPPSLSNMHIKNPFLVDASLMLAAVCFLTKGLLVWYYFHMCATYANSSIPLDRQLKALHYMHIRGLRG